MLWPGLRDYTEAIRDFPHISILDPELRGGNPQRSSNNYLMVYSGGFSGVFPIEVLSNTYALRCWTRDIGDAETRYKEISDYLKQYRLPYFVDFAYVPEGILVNGVRYPITRMEWAEGNTLCDFIEHNLQDARCLKTAAAEFQKMVAALHTHQISHGDLQDGNILLKRSGTDVEIKLIDYDSVFVPALRGQPDTIVGVPAYQHPQRIARGVSTAEKMDYFSELVIYLSLLSLAEKPDLWSQFGAPTERRLLFIAEDFTDPDQSDVFRELENLSPDVKRLASKLKEFCKRSVDQLEPLEAVLPKTSPGQVAYNQGIAHLNRNRYSEAVVEFEKAIGLDRNYKEAHHGLGLAHLKIGNLGEAERAAKAALRIDPHYQPARQLLDAVLRKTSPGQVAYNQGIAYLNKNRYNEAVVEFEKAIGLNPNYKEAHRGLGIAHLKMNNPGEAKRAAEAALRIDPHYRPARQLLDVIESFKPPPVPPPPPSPEKSGQASTKGWQYTTGALAFILLICVVTLATQTNTKDEALRQSSILIQTLSNEKAQLQNQLAEQNRETRTQMAVVRRLQREKKELLSEKQKLQNENVRLREQLRKQHPPLDPPPRDDRKDDEQFRATAPQKIYHNSTPRVRSAAISKNDLGCDAFNKNQYSEAIEFFDDAIKSDSQSAIVHYNLGCTYLAMAEYDRAINYLDRAVVLDRKFKEAHYNLALAFFRRGDHQTAVTVARKALNIDENYLLAQKFLEAVE